MCNSCGQETGTETQTKLGMAKGEEGEECPSVHGEKQEEVSVSTYSVQRSLKSDSEIKADVYLIAAPRKLGRLALQRYQLKGFPQG